MKSIVRYLLVVACVVALASGLAQSQSLLEQLQRTTEQGLQGYLSPILSGWAADFNSGFYHSADLHDVLGFDVGIKVSAALIKDVNKTYSLAMPDHLDIIIPGYYTGTLIAGQDYETNYTLPTAVGAKGKDEDLTAYGLGTYKNVKVIRSRATTATGGQEIPLMVLPGGFDVPAVPLILPQLNLGLPFGIEVMVRYVPKRQVGDFGKVSLTGFGLRYNVDQWIPKLPVDLAVHFMTQKFKLSSTDINKQDHDFLDASATSYGLEVSKRFFILTLYGGFDIQKSSFTVSSIQLAPQPETPSGLTVPGFTINGVNKSRGVVGVRVLLAIVNVHAEYSIAKQPMLAAGVGISIR
jgi:hypothetical protein